MHSRSCFVFAIPNPFSHNFKVEFRAKNVNFSTYIKESSENLLFYN